MDIMDKIISGLTFTRVGLMMNFLGTVMMFFSFGKNIEGGYQKNEEGENIYLSSFLYPGLFRCGMVLLGFGFALQLID